MGEVFCGFDSTLKTREGLGLGLFRITGLTRHSHVDIGCHPYDQTSTDISLWLRAIWAENKQQRKKTCNFVACIALNIIITKGLQCPCPPKFWSALSEPEPVQFHWLSAEWKERIWRLGIPLYHGILGVSLGHAETRSSIPQLSAFILPP